MDIDIKAKPIILLVMEGNKARDVMEAELIQHGCDVMVASGREGAINKVFEKGKFPNGIIVDMVLREPFPHGEELLRSIGGRSVNVLMMNNGLRAAALRELALCGLIKTNARAFWEDPVKEEQLMEFLDLLAAAYGRSEYGSEYG